MTRKLRNTLVPLLLLLLLPCPPGLPFAAAFWPAAAVGGLAGLRGVMPGAPAASLGCPGVAASVMPPAQTPAAAMRPADSSSRAGGGPARGCDPRTASLLHTRAMRLPASCPSVAPAAMPPNSRLAALRWAGAHGEPSGSATVDLPGDCCAWCGACARQQLAGHAHKTCAPGAEHVCTARPDARYGHEVDDIHSDVEAGAQPASGRRQCGRCGALLGVHVALPAASSSIAGGDSRQHAATCTARGRVGARGLPPGAARGRCCRVHKVQQEKRCRQAEAARRAAWARAWTSAHAADIWVNATCCYLSACRLP
jgi:hypothetical protein